MAGRQVAITGLGAVSPLGLSVDSFWQGLLAERCGLGPIRAFDASAFPCMIAGEAPDYNLRDYVPKSHRKATKLMSRDIELAVIAVKEAVDSSGWITKSHEGQTPTLVSQRTAINFGAGLICCDLTEMSQSVSKCITDGKFDIRKWGRDGLTSLTPLWLLKYLPNMLPCHAAIIHDIQGPSNTITAGEVGSYLAAAEAMEMIIRGDADTAIAGGGENKANPLGVLRPAMMGRTNCQSNSQPDKACRPFDKDANGSIFSEAAGAIVMEELEQARSRGAKIFALLAGSGSSHSLNSDYFHLEADGKAVCYAIESALEEAKLRPDELDLIIPCGSAIPQDDAAEAAGIQTALKDAASAVPVWPIKSLVGHSGAASGILEIIAGTLSIEHGKTGKAVNFEQPAAGCRLNILRKPLDKPIRNVLCCGYSFGGQTAAVVLKKLS